MAPHAVPSTSPLKSPDGGFSFPVANGESIIADALPNGSTEQPDKSMPIAIVGIGCRCPGDATNPENLWRMVSEAREAWTELPKSKYNAEAFHHPDTARNGTSNIRGGHFLTEDQALFDAPFFGITSNEAAVMDPQQRLLLETCYEAIENAGIPMDTLVGSNTSCFVGSFCRDFADIQLRDTETLPVYQATGGGPSLAFLSNRISHFFDLRGPSVSVDTACSASLVALHLACQTIRTGESKAAIVGGSNVLLSHEIMITMNMMRFLSPDGRCYSFDHRANGYARGEGAACVVLKPLADAIESGDTIRAVIRQTGINQDGKTPGITLPSKEAQQALIENVYDAAGLDPVETSYVEAHGTGTPAGDPLEASALARVFAPGRPADKPLRIGSVKSNMGHLEGCSGLAGLIKTVLMLENDLILPNRNFEKGNPHIPFDKWKLKVPTSIEGWGVEGIRRASINSFGYGGTNAHAIIDDALHYLRSRSLPALHRKTPSLLPKQLGSMVSYASGGDVAAGGVSSNKKVFTISAFDEKAGKRQAENIATYLDERSQLVGSEMLEHLAFTLNERRTNFPWKTAVSAGSVDSLLSLLRDEDLKFSKTTKPPTIAFVFTGQGAQWNAMGRQLFTAYPVYRESIERSSRKLRAIGAPWDLLEELSKDATRSRVAEAALSQPLCTVVQIALVDLLASFNVRPIAVTGHSSGEIASAYTIGALTHEDAIAVAYFRGELSTTIKSRSGCSGAMMAVGMAKADLLPLIDGLNEGKAVVACENSPSSVTVSGDETAVSELLQILKAKKVFARKLVVEVAYHSHHMQVVADDYMKALDGLKTHDSNGIQFFSSVTGDQADAHDLDARYWVANMVSEVKFSASLKKLCLGANAGKKRRKKQGNPEVDLLIEVGPHSALAGPIKQILQAEPSTNGYVNYGSVLARDTDAVDTILKLVNQLYMKGSLLNFKSINRANDEYRQVLMDLPPYAWNHSIPLWAESRLSRTYRNREYPRTDLLGVADKNSNALEPRWRNIIRPSEVPWIRDHKVQSNIVYPAAGYVTMAIEAAHQRAVGRSQEVSGFTLREITVGTALLVPDHKPEVETLITLKPYNEGTRSSSDIWDEFCIFSVAEDDTWTQHCRGLISVQKASVHTEVDGGRETQAEIDSYIQLISSSKAKAYTSVSTEELYENLRGIGLDYGPTFANLTSIKALPNEAVGSIRIPNTAAVMPENHQYPFILHPATLDSCIHPIFSAVAAADGPLTVPMVPTYIEQIDVSKNIINEAGSELTVYANAQPANNRQRKVDLLVFEETRRATQPVINVRGLTCTKLSSDQGLQAGEQVKKLCYNMEWQADVDLMSREQLENLSANSRSSSNKTLHVQAINPRHDFVSRYIDLLAYKNPHLSVLEVGAGTGEYTSSILHALGGTDGAPLRCSEYKFTDSSTELFGSLADKFKPWEGLVEFEKLDIEQDPTTQGFEDGNYDFVVFTPGTYAGCSTSDVLRHVRKLLKPSGKLCLILPMHENATPSTGSHIHLSQPKNGGLTEQRGSHMTEDQWHTLLQEARFSGVDAAIWHSPNEGHLPDSMILSSATSDQALHFHNVNIVTDERTPKGLVAQLQASLRENGVDVSISRFPDAGPEERISIVLVELTRSVLQDPSEEDFACVKKLALDSKAVLWVTHSASIVSEAPDANMITGLARTVRSENGGFNFVVLDIDSHTQTSDESSANAISCVFRSNFALPSDSEVILDAEYAYRDGYFMIPRVIEDVSMNKSIAVAVANNPVPEEQPFLQQGRTLALEIESPGLLDTLRFVDDKRMDRPLPTDEVEIEIHAAGLNFRDVMMAMGQIKVEPLGGDCSGVISAVGSSVVGLRPGDRVVTYGDGTFSNYVRQQAQAVQLIPENISMEAAATLPIILCTAYQSVFISARLQKGETCLIHAASGGLGQVLIMLCQMVGVEVFLTCGTLEKKEFLMKTYNIPEDHIFSSRDSTFAKGIMRMTTKGVDVIMNSVAGDALRVTWDCIAPFGRFIELGKRDFANNTRLEMGRFAKNVSFAAVDFIHLCKDRPVETAKMWAAAMDLIRDGSVRPPQPITAYGMGEVEKALRIMQAGKHIGKLVLVAKDDEVVKALPQDNSQSLLRKDASYLLVGGLGGIGRALAIWMIQHGAQNIIFASRSGLTKQSSRHTVKHLEAQGARVKVHSCDISDPEHLETLVSESIKDMPPIRGVVQGAMVLRDSLFQNMTLADYEATIRPKVAGTWNLHNLLPKDLDFFIMLSSISGIIGNVSQAQYAAASTFLDAFANYRNSRGLPAVSLDLGVILDVGYVAENEKLLKAFEKQNFEGITEAELMAMIQHAIAHPFRTRPGTGQTVTGLGTWRADGSQPAHAYPIFSHFRHTFAQTSDVEGSGSGSGDQAGLRIRDALKTATSMDDAAQKVCTCIIAKISALLMVSRDDISPSKAMSDYGIDSLVAVEMRNWLFREMDITVSILELMANKALSKLAADIVGKSKLLPGSITAAAT